ncbi:30S ribosomal protein S17 [bacterium]|nr:30S ribosomal protein S17 [bacterium]
MNGKRKIREGTVVSNKMDKTIKVLVETYVQHPLLKKTIRRRTKLTAHDPENKCRIGDRVRIVETRPLSRTKRWRLVDIVRRTKR